MFSIQLRQAEHTRHYSIHFVARSGWELRLEEDNQLTRQTRYHDWHRVERMLGVMQREVSELMGRGWRVDS